MASDSEPSGVAIVYGRGGGLGSFVPFVNTLKQRLAGRFRDRITVQNIERRDAFFDFLRSPGVSYPLEEFHVFSHSIGAGLFIGYGDPQLNAQRLAAFVRADDAGRRITYGEVIAAEAGAVFTDNLVEGPAVLLRDTIRRNFAPTATAKFWGCNAGVAGWEYSDESVDGQPAPYYWRALNTKNVPKPSIAQAFADYLNIVVFGAGSGSDVRVEDHGHWITSEQYRRAHHRWPSGRLPQRLQPTRGDYIAFSPSGG